ncbi:MAG: SNF2 family helicase [Fusicatenibacter sp.]|nr:SNF2 family helicase [Fusicatenibacter sp.]
MITKSDIKNETNSTSYSHGMNIYDEQKVHELEVEEMEDEYGDPIREIRALVTGSGKNCYQVCIHVDENLSEIVDDECECPAHEQYWGLCKHCVAALLAYIDWRRDSRRRMEAQVSQTKEESALEKLLAEMGVKKGSGFGSARRNLPQKNRQEEIPKTSQGFTELLSRYAMRDKAVYLPKVKAGQVRLEAYVEMYGSTMNVEFKIGITRMYVLKSISKMVAAIRNMETVSYGTQLSFLHCVDAFCEESKPMVSFLMSTMEENNHCYRSAAGYYASYLDDRQLELNLLNTDEFFEALGDQEFYLHTFDDDTLKWRCVRHMPDFAIQIRKKNTAVTVKMERNLMVTSKRYIYFFERGIVYQVPKQEMEDISDFLEYMLRRPDGVCVIASEDLPAFCQELLPLLEKHFTVEKEDLELTAYLPPEVKFQVYLDAPQQDMISCELLAVYGDKKYNVFADANNIWQLAKARDVKKEMAANQLVRSYFGAYDSRKKLMILQGADGIYELLTRGIGDLRRLGDVFVSDQMKAIRMLPSPKVSVGVSLSGELLELNLKTGGFPMEELASILSKYDRKKKYFRLKSGEFVDMDDDGIRVLTELREGLQLTEARLRSGTVSVPKYRAMYLDARLKEGLGLPVSKNRDFRALVRNMKTVEDNDFEFPSGLFAELREYQKTGFLWIKTLCANGFGGILADDMGLGKTLQMIAFLLSEMEEAKEGELKRTLIIAPASLVYNWQSECRRFAPSLQVQTVTGTQEQRKEIIENAGARDILITSYDLLRRDIEVYGEIPFFCEIIDEAQFIKNHTTQGARAVKMIQAGFRMALTGTPVENQLSELWSIFDYLMSGFLYSYQRFREQFETPIVKNRDEETLARLQKMIQPFILRRLKKDVLKDLPDKIEKNTYARMEGEQEELYEAHVQRLQLQLSKQTEEEFADSRFQILSELTRLRQLCCDPSLIYENYKGRSAKLDLCVELVKNAVESGHKILLFSQFTSMLEILTARLTKEKISFFVLNGSTSKERRAQMVEKFNRDDTCVFCISLKAGGTGLNLTGADIVIHYDPWWNVAVENQATDRAHRIGQKNVVTVYKLIAEGTIEEKIIRLQNRKKELADEVLSGEQIQNASFSREELLELLQ